MSYNWENIGKRFLQTKSKQYGIIDISSGFIVNKVEEDFELLMNGDTMHIRRNKLDAIVALFTT